MRHMGRLLCIRSRNANFTFQRNKHQYTNIHPWESQLEFSKHLIDNVIYNNDGIVVLNKPMGISGEKKMYADTNKNYKKCDFIVNEKLYSIQKSLPYIAKELDYSELIIASCPEKYTSGVTILVANEDMKSKYDLCVRRTKQFYKTFWVVTSSIPKLLEGQRRLGMKVPPNSNAKADLVRTFSNTDIKKQRVKLLQARFKVLSKSTGDLSSLLELTISTTHCHAVRLFVTKELLCPVLGDNYYGPTIKKIMNSYLPILNPLAVPPMPVLPPELLRLLNVSKAKQEIIPPHVHLRSLFIPSFLKDRDHIEAPILDPFKWTCEQLQFKFKQNIKQSENNLIKQSLQNRDRYWDR